MKTELCTSTCANEQLRVQRHAVELESRYTTLSVDRYLKYSNQLLLESSDVYIVHTCGYRLEARWTTGSSATE